MSKKTKYKVSISFWTVVILLLVFNVLIYWNENGTINGMHILTLSIVLYNLLNRLTWGIREKGQVDDELDNHIQSNSATLSYFILMISSVAIYFLFSEKNNYPLLAVIAIILITKPLLELAYSKNFK